ncbi:hypothetical protein LIA77_04169 [Sarocladium implicatum]|nr:hypothetical protein LIA77_04169 [Sarocladium implicatum]
MRSQQGRGGRRGWSTKEQVRSATASVGGMVGALERTGSCGGWAPLSLITKSTRLERCFRACHGHLHPRRTFTTPADCAQVPTGCPPPSQCCRRSKDVCKLTAHRIAASIQSQSPNPLNPPVDSARNPLLDSCKGPRHPFHQVYNTHLAACIPPKRMYWQLGPARGFCLRHHNHQGPPPSSSRLRGRKKALRLDRNSLQWRCKPHRSASHHGLLQPWAKGSTYVVLDGSSTYWAGSKPRWACVATSTHNHLYRPSSSEVCHPSHRLASSRLRASSITGDVRDNTASHSATVIPYRCRLPHLPIIRTTGRTFASNIIVASSTHVAPRPRYRRLQQTQARPRAQTRPRDRRLFGTVALAGVGGFSCPLVPFWQGNNANAPTQSNPRRASRIHLAKWKHVHCVIGHFAPIPLPSFLFQTPKRLLCLRKRTPLTHTRTIAPGPSVDDAH